MILRDFTWPTPCRINMWGDTEMRHVNFIKVLGLAGFSLLTACSSGFQAMNKPFSSLNGVGDLTNDIVNQAPKINCVMTNGATGATREIHTISEQDTFFSVLPRAGETLSLDCSSTSDENQNDLTFAIDTDYSPDAPNFVALSEVSSINLTAAGSYSYAIQATDKEGLKRVKTFTLVVQCQNDVIPAVDVAGISVVGTGTLNYFNYSVSAAAVTGGDGFEYSWDFNGDGVFDPFSMTSTDTWSATSSANDVFTIFANQRKIALKVRNSCQFETVVYADVNFSIPNIDRTAVAQAVPMGYHYIQADVRGRSGTVATDQRRNGDLIVTQMPSTPVKRVKCDYNYNRAGQKAGFNLYGMNWYNNGSEANFANVFLHGMSIKLTGIPDTGAASEQTYNQSHGVQLASISYDVSAADDGLPHETFNSIQTACTVEVTIVRAQPVAPCADGLKAEADFADLSAIQIYGEFNCPSIRNTANTASVAAENGKFFCEVAPSNQCIGGGGGGGGTPPPEQ